MPPLPVLVWYERERNIPLSNQRCFATQTGHSACSMFRPSWITGASASQCADKAVMLGGVGRICDVMGTSLGQKRNMCWCSSGKWGGEEKMLTGCLSPRPSWSSWESQFNSDPHSQGSITIARSSPVQRTQMTGLSVTDTGSELSHGGPSASQETEEETTWVERRKAFKACGEAGAPSLCVPQTLGLIRRAATCSFPRNPVNASEVGRCQTATMSRPRKSCSQHDSQHGCVLVPSAVTIWATGKDQSM